MKRTSFAAALLAAVSIAALAQAPAAAPAPAAAAASDVWQIDTSHSTAEFTVRHMMVSKVKGRFGKVTGTVTGDLAKPETAVVDVVIDATSIDTDNDNRDAHLKSADFFEVDKYPVITFKSKKIVKAGEGYAMTGDLTMRGVTKEVLLAVEGPVAPVKAGKSLRSGASAKTRLNRKDYGLTWNRSLDEGGIAVSDEVDIALEVELVQKTE